MRRIFLQERRSKIRRTAGYVTDFRVVLLEKKTSNIKSYFWTVPNYKNSIICAKCETIIKKKKKSFIYILFFGIISQKPGDYFTIFKSYLQMLYQNFRFQKGNFLR